MRSASYGSKVGPIASCGSSRTLTSHIKDMSPVVILRLRNMTALDATGLRAMQDFADAIHASGRLLLLCGAPPQPARLMARAEFHRHVGAENILPNVEAALARAVELRRAIA
jgi:sulfate permease, SulP family